ncbi:hypothetical protein [Rahnella sikkimica]|uniref:Uncharacterized protein n=1 Tax=Rahnella sikkimica TaxID=1805933 RepID=A0A2L1UXV0_9GAMM|nr:hypothetical protein [Rahnella sikkimica]AVF37668.1 hypothetical protein BV494_22375 [Rahnella sikkimica]
MSYRFTLAAIAAVFALTGCAKTKTAEQPAFDLGSTRLTVTHVPTKTDDGTKIYVTIDGKDAGALGLGESVEVQLPEGKHKVGGYARSLIGRVTISPVDVTTSRNDISHVTYSVANLKPTFLVRATTPVPKPKSESVPLEPIPALPTQIEAPATDVQAQTATPAATATATTAAETTTPAAAATAPATTTTPATTTAPATATKTETTTTPAASATTPATTTQTETTTTPATTTTQSVPVTTLQSQTDTTTSSPQAANITELEDPQS